MGLIDFVKSAGEKLFGGEEKVDQEGSAKLENYVRKMGLEIEHLKIDIAGDVATVSGKVNSQQEREKVVLAVGNTAGIARADDQIEVKKEPEAAFYTVEKGDTLSKIAKRQYGDPMKYPVNFEANRPMLKDPDLIYSGQVLRIPPPQA